MFILQASFLVLHSHCICVYCPVLLSSINIRCFLSLSSALPDLWIHLVPFSLLIYRDSLLHPAISEFVTKIYRRGSPSTTACPEITTTILLPAFTGIETITELVPASCPTSTAIAFDGPCTDQVLEDGCGEIQCIDLITTTVGCPGKCCPAQIPVTTTTLPCTRTCGAGRPGGCPKTEIETSTVGC